MQKFNYKDINVVENRQNIILFLEYFQRIYWRRTLKACIIKQVCIQTEPVPAAQTDPGFAGTNWASKIRTVNDV